MPWIVLQNRQRRVQVDLAWLQDIAVRSMDLVLDLPKRTNRLLADLEEISVALLSDRAMARLHVQFMDIRGPTDVLTFDHGEILISAETAARYAKEYGHSTQEEIALYLLHGLLHLSGFDDRVPQDHREMHDVQNALFARLRGF